VNLAFALWNPTPFFSEPVSWVGYEFIEDLGVSRHEFGNAGGGRLGGDFRSLIVRDPNGNDSVIRLTAMALPRLVKDSRFGNQKGRTYLNVAICDEERHHNSLELCIDTFAEPIDRGFRFWHDGRIAVGNMGQLPREKVLEHVRQRVPHLVSESRVLLGTVPNDRVLEWEDIRELLLNMTVYAILRDEIRYQVKTERRALG
jgi:hypothetical protein